MLIGPNIFDFATKELSQDAFLCWLAQWADPKFRTESNSLHELGKQFLRVCYNKYGKNLPEPLATVTVKKQVSDLDILIVVNDKDAILIEDKVATKEHSNQLERYKNSIASLGYENLYPIYFKTMNQSNIDNVIESGYQIFSRGDMLDVLGNGLISTVSDSIITAYYDYLSQIENRIQNFKTSRNWDYHSWMGFYTEVQQSFSSRNGWCAWDYVPNQNGGFLGLWWLFKSDKSCEQHLQLEYDKLCFKVTVDNEEERSNLRNSWYEAITQTAISEGFNIKKPDRFGHGRVMTVAQYEGDYRVFDGDTLDLFRTLEILKKAEEVLNKARNKSNK